MELLFPLLLFAAMWFLLIRPQQQRVRAQRALLESLVVGQEVITAGGIIGTITSISGEEVAVAVAPGIELRVVRQAIARVLDDGLANDEPDDALESDELPPGGDR